MSSVTPLGLRSRSPSTESRPFEPKPSAAPARSILSDIEIEYGPRDLLGTFFLQAETAARERGIFLSLASLDELMAVNRANAATWRPVIPVFDPAFGAIESATSFAILGRNDSGEVVATQAARLFDWTATDFRTEAESLRLFYTAPESQKHPGERIEVTAPGAENIYGRCLYSGAAWYRPDYRKRWLTGIMPRFGRALAYTRWSTDVTLTLMHERIVASGTAERVGYRSVEWDVTIFNTPLAERFRCALLSMPTAVLLDDLKAFRDLPDAKIDPVVLDRAG